MSCIIVYTAVCFLTVLLLCSTHVGMGAMAAVPDIVSAILKCIREETDQ